MSIAPAVAMVGERETEYFINCKNLDGTIDIN